MGKDEEEIRDTMDDLIKYVRDVGEGEFFPLIVASSTEEEDTIGRLRKLREFRGQFSKYLGPGNTSWANYEQYEDGKRKDDYNVVLIPLLGDDLTAREIKAQAEFYQYYGAAPVTAWILRKELRKGLKSLITKKHKVF